MFFVLNYIHAKGFKRSLDPFEVLGDLAARVREGALAGGLGAALGPRVDGTRHAARVLPALAEAITAQVDAITTEKR